MVQFKETHASGATVIISNKDINDKVKIVKALEDADILVKGVTKTLQNDVKKEVPCQFYQCYWAL